VTQVSHQNECNHTQVNQTLTQLVSILLQPSRPT